MAKKRLVVFLALLAALTLVAGACGGGDNKGTDNVAKGGTFRIQTDQLLWDADLDPTGEYLGFAWDWFYAMHRPLLGYNHKLASKGGDEIKPDLATDTGQVSADGLTWTFKIKDVKFGPPVNRAVTTKDIAYAIARSGNLDISASGPGPTYFAAIEGFTAVTEKKATTVSGITTPDDKTIVFKLTQPTGDFRYRMAMPVGAPIPEEVAKCATKAGEYGRLQISTGPYMLEGIDKVDISSCDKAKAAPAAGHDPTQFTKLVRNPNYDASTDTKDMRSNFVDRIEMTLNTNRDDIEKKVLLGQVDDGEVTVSPATLNKGETDATVKDNIHVDPGDRTWYLSMALNKAPFDDIAVRKAANFIMDKTALVRARGGKYAGIPAEHIIPPDVLGRLKAGEFDPYASPNHSGNLDAAKEEMKKSKYDTNKDGICDARQCKNVVHITRSADPYPNIATIVENSLAKIGITLKTRAVDSYYSTVQVPTVTPPIGSGAGWGKDFADAGTFYTPLLSSAAINVTATQNFAFLGLTKAQSTKIKIPFPSGGIPSADAGIAECQAKVGDARNDCWAALDQKTMNEMVPWIPYLWANNITLTSDAVTNYEFDQGGSGEIAFVHVAVDSSKQVQ
ncbi:MAG: ABC transporter substrate-binding protein [Actinomycetota bacterium]